MESFPVSKNILKVKHKTHTKKIYKKKKNKKKKKKSKTK